MRSGFSFSAWTTILRAGNSLTGFFGVAFGAVLVLGEIPQGSLAQITLLHSISVWCFMCSWNALNDILDVKIDGINRPNRPLPSGVISLSQAKFVTGLLMMVSLGSLIFAGNIASGLSAGVEGWYPSVAIWLFAIFLLTNYESSGNLSLKLKDRGLPGNIAISLSVGMVVLFGAAGVFDWANPKVISIFFIGFFYNLGREIIKDIEDMDGDQGRNTLAMRIGPEKARLIAWTLMLVTMITVLLPFGLGIFPLLHLLLVTPGIISLQMVKAKLANSEDHAAQSLIKKSMQLTLIGLMISAIMV